jgi:D-galactose 1-dehydrogenase
MSRPINLGLVGIGKIARDQHLPAIADNPDFALIAAASRHPFDRALIRYATIDEMMAGEPDLEALSLCTPPVGRHVQAAAALAAGKHVMLEKPPGATVSEVTALTERARHAGLTLFASWHSREAAGVAPARDWLADKSIRSVKIVWKEDVRRWHPGQDWIFAPGGLGVFDPAINALSILTEILPAELTVVDARLDFPANRQAPIAAAVTMEMSGGVRVEADLDFLQTGQQSWDILVETEAGALALSGGGTRLRIGDADTEAPNREYAGLYKRFAELIAAGQSDVDLRPLQLVADTFLIGERREVEPFDF